MSSEDVNDPRPHVLFVTVPSALGGSNRALVTLLAALGDRVTRIVAGPPAGALREAVLRGGLAEEYLGLTRARRTGRVGRAIAAVRLAIWVVRRRGGLHAIHANATTGFNISAPAAIVSRLPLVAWIHDSVSTPWGRRSGRTLRHMLGDVRYVAVSPTAAEVVEQNGLCRASDVVIVPNPIDSREVVSEAWEPSPDGRIRIGFLGAPTEAKGFDLLPEVIARTSDLPVLWKLFVTRRDGAFEAPIWSRLDGIDGRIEAPGRVRDVREAYAQVDVIFNPSRTESFSRVTAEAFMNGLPVVASDIPAIRSLMTDEGSDGLFAVGDVDAAADAIRRVVASGDRSRGKRHGERPEFDPEQVAEQMLAIYRAP